MKTQIITFLALAAVLTGCGTTGASTVPSNPSIETRLANAEKANQALQAQVAALKQQPSESSPAASAADPQAIEGPIVGNLVHPSVYGYPCYMSAGDPSYGDPNWVWIRNTTNAGDAVMSLDGTAVDNDGVTLGSGRPIVVLMPGPAGKWLKRFVGAGILTGLPSGAVCWIHLEGRLDGNGSLMTHELHAQFYRLDTNPMNPMTRIARHQATLLHPMVLAPRAYGQAAGHNIEYFEVATQ